MIAVFDRADARRRLAAEEFDVLVIGGGITGAGCALDAASRGLRTALVERDDFASGTSSKSSKMVHGGLRYLSQGEVGLVYEALHERQRLLRNAPHLVRILPFLLPVFSGKGGVVPKQLSRAMGSAMWGYDVTGGARIGKIHRRLSVDEVLEHMPTLNAKRLAPSYLYYDARADDARLVLTIVRTAVTRHDAVALNGCAVQAITKDAAGRATGARVSVDGEEIDVRATAVVNATGVWADDVRALDEGTHPDSIRPAKGIHITIPWRLVRNDIAAVVPVRGDSRSIFVVPWGDFTYAGTTDTDYDGSLDDPQCTAEDVDYVLRALNAALTTEITVDDVLGTWAGLRPLVKDASSERTADLSRRHSVRTSRSGVVTITGGKLTTYREMAEETIDHVVDEVLAPAAGWSLADRLRRRCRTKRLALAGADGYRDVRDAAPALSRHVAARTVDHLVGRYGADARTLVAMADRDPALAEPLVPGLPYLRAEALYAVRYEMARDLDDVLSRRTRARLLARDASWTVAADVAALVADDLGWDAADQAEQAAHYRALIEAERTAPGLPETTLDRLVGA